MSQMLLDTASNDLVRVGGTFVRVSDLPEAVQHVDTRLRIFRGEVFLDIEIGIDFFEEILRKQINPAAVIGEFRDAILGTPGIVEIVTLVINLDAANRRLEVEWSAFADLDDLNERILIHDKLSIPPGGEPLSEAA